MVKIQGKQRVIKRYTHHLSNKGSVKETWGVDDYGIDIRGLLFLPENETYSQDDSNAFHIKKINDFFLEGMVSVSCPLLALFNINYMFIENMNFPFDREGLQIIPFELSGVSDFRSDELLTEIL